MPNSRRLLAISVLTLSISCVLVTNCIAQMLMTGFTRREDIHANVHFTARGMLWNAQVSVPGAAYLRIFFTNIQSKDQANYRIRFLNSLGSPLAEIPRDEFQKSASFVTSEIQTSFIEVQVVVDTASPDSTLSFDLSETGFDARRPALLSTPASGSDLQSINSFSPADRIRQAATAVARLSTARLDTDGLHKLYTCSGFMVAATLLVTNYHCVRSPEDCVVTAAYFARPNEQGILDESLTAYCDELIEAVYGLDISVLRVRWQTNSQHDNLQVGRLSIANRDIKPGEHLTIIGHPNGDPLEVSAANCRVRSQDAPGMWHLNRTDFGHTCTTAEGSSGSPVIDESNEVVGLHHLGFDTAGPWASENRAVKAAQFSKLINDVIEISKPKNEGRDGLDAR
jgi:V8-like Glu-specific endopeptidase